LLDDYFELASNAMLFEPWNFMVKFYNFLKFQLLSHHQGQTLVPIWSFAPLAASAMKCYLFASLPVCLLVIHYYWKCEVDFHCKSNETN
jgi:hypothetical protein